MAVTRLPAIQREIIRYGVSLYLVLGVVGSICNCLIFTRRAYRRSPSSIYLLSLSIFSIMFLLWTLPPLLYALNNTDLQTQSVFYCKVRQYGSHTFSLFLRYAVVLACIDRFFATRANVRLRSLSSIKAAIILVCIMCVICTLVPLHMPILMYINSAGTCGMFGMYKLSYAIYQIIFFTFTPPILMAVFSLLTIRDLYQRHNASQVSARKLDRHLAYMVITEVVINIISSVPYGINLLYGALTYYVTNKTTERLEIEAFYSFISLMLVYLTGVVPFYLFISISRPFRLEFINLCRSSVLRRFPIVPTNDANTIIMHPH
ncbi:unnamed protein product [Adineta ricciae]|uniref:G-protein coupled receptors family 1 profile domain-containing protein n=1 Tax=Adineta ricciae TaxID=249248 RepID=A0A814PYP7_ADIRI|nr:unnamed protein product [Adineta ricciae]CAF1287644.1 unnamed protein product [Adineta ricciae]